MVGVGSSKLAQVTHRAPADLTVHVHLLHLMLRTHQYLRIFRRKTYLIVPEGKISLGHTSATHSCVLYSYTGCITYRTTRS